MGKIRPTYGQRVAKPTTKGYLRKWYPEHPTAVGGLVLLHRQVWYDNYGEIPKGYQVHHIDGNKLNNEISNLEICTNSEHQLKHRKAGSDIKNQYGTFKVKPVEERASTKLKQRILNGANI